MWYIYLSSLLFVLPHSSVSSGGWILVLPVLCTTLSPGPKTTWHTVGDLTHEIGDEKNE